MTEYPFIKVAELPNQTIYAKRTDAGGVAYYTDQYGAECLIVDMTTTDEFTLKMILQLHKHLEQKARGSTGTRYDIMEIKERKKQEEAAIKTPKAGRIDRMGRCIKCGIVQSITIGSECDFYGCPQKD